MGGGGLIAKKTQGCAVTLIPSITIIFLRRSANHPPEPALCLTFFASPDTPSDFWRCHAARLGSFWTLISLSQSAWPGTAVPGPQPLTLSARTDLSLASGRPGRLLHIPQEAGWEHSRPAPSILWEFITSQGTPARQPRCRPRRPASPPASLKLQPSEEKKEQNHKFRLIKHLLILQQFSRPLRNPPETRGAPVIFCYIIFLVKYFPRQSSQRGSNITVTNQNQCALTY